MASQHAPTIGAKTARSGIVLFVPLWELEFAAVKLMPTGAPPDSPVTRLWQVMQLGPHLPYRDQDYGNSSAMWLHSCHFNAWQAVHALSLYPPLNRCCGLSIRFSRVIIRDIWGADSINFF